MPPSTFQRYRDALRAMQNMLASNPTPEAMATALAHDFAKRYSSASNKDNAPKSAAVGWLGWLVHTLGFSPALTRGFLFQFQELKGASFIQVEIRGAPNRGPEPRPKMSQWGWLSLPIITVCGQRWRVG